jgi:hypothetical protein
MAVKKKRRYAEGTKVPVESSQAEVRRYLKARGASEFGVAYLDGKGSQVVCSLEGRKLRFMVPHCKDSREEARLWRVLMMRVKLRYEEFSSGEVPFDEAFISFILLPDGRTMASHCLPQIERAYRNGAVPAQLGWEGDQAAQ